MTARLIDGKAIASELRGALRERIAAAPGGAPPPAWPLFLSGTTGLSIYVRSKRLPATRWASTA
jgi:hypothetical protein